jgi:hypothetical protein
VSYVPYHPDVWPSEPVDDLRPRIRALRWACAFLLYLLGIAAWVVWMKLPPAIEKPLATIPLPDGSELRLVHLAVGTDPEIHWGANFGNRVRVDKVRGSGGRLQDPHGGVWMVFTQFHPKRKTFGDPGLATLEIVEEGSPYPLRPSRWESGPGPYRVALFQAVPRRPPTLTFQTTYQGAPFRGTIDNLVLPGTGGRLPVREPAAVASPAPAPLPQILTSDGFTVRLEKMTFRAWSNQAPGFPAVRADAHYTVTHPVARAGDYSLSYEWFDFTGNRVNDTVLPWSEEIWGWRLRARETPSFPVSPDRLVTLGKVIAPGPGQVTKLPVPPEMKADGVTDILVVGTGSYSWAGNRLMAGSGGAGGSQVSVVKTTGARQYGSISESAWGLYLLSGSSVGRIPNDPRMQLRVRRGDVVCTHGSSGSSSSHAFRQQHYSHFRLFKGGLVAAGEEVTVEGFQPKVHTFEFLIPRPDFPAKLEK